MIFANMEFTASKFREMFPEFKDVNEYPDAQIELYIEMSGAYITTGNSRCNMLNGKRLFTALMLMAAHLLSIHLESLAKSAVGENPGSAQGGFTQSASIGDVSVTKAQIPAVDMWDWWLASTPYGQQLKAILSIASVGGLYVGGMPETRGFRKFGGVF